MDLSTPATTADFLREELQAMFPNHHVQVTGERGVGVVVARMDAEAYAKKNWIEGWSNVTPNLWVRICLAPGWMASGWTQVNLGMDADKAELKQAGIPFLRRRSDITPEKGVEVILAWFRSNQGKL